VHVTLRRREITMAGQFLNGPRDDGTDAETCERRPRFVTVERARSHRDRGADSLFWRKAMRDPKHSQERCPHAGMNAAL
jgi:hypothetical protein